MSGYTEPQNPIGTVSELFAGVGGFRIGLSKSGWKTTFSNQWEPSTKSQHASDVYVARFGEEGHTNDDIAKVLDLHDSGVITIPKTTMLVGGFPCQDYSVAKSLSSSKGLSGKKGVLWWEILRLIEANKPPIVFLENVDRLLKSPAKQRGRDFAVMLASLSDAGYFVEWRVINAADYGFPQRRKRVFIVAKNSKEFDAPDQSEIEHFLLSQGVLARALPVESDRLPIVFSEFQISGNLAEITEKFDVGGAKSPFLNSGFIVERNVVTTELSSKSHLGGTLGSVLEPDENVPDEYFVEDTQLENWKYLKGSKKEERTHAASGTTYFYTEGSMAFPDSLDKPARTILTGEGGKTPTRFKHIVRTSSNRYRRLLPVELERLNGFPDGWTKTTKDGNTIPDSRRAFFMGNALVIGIVERIGQVLAADWVNNSSR